MRSTTIRYIKLLLVFASYVKVIINKSKKVREFPIILNNLPI